MNTDSLGFLFVSAFLEKVRHYCFAFANEENSLNVRCHAAPVFNHNGEPIAALGTSTTILQLDKTHLPKVFELVKDAAQKVSRQIGYSDKKRNLNF
ncbi:MAG: hypothetical protein H0X49_12630 [Acidobacteria bacterium]|nr:hypothetical protein [Acidobacteriota bacterium]